MTPPAIYQVSQLEDAVAVHVGEPGWRADGQAAGERSREGGDE